MAETARVLVLTASEDHRSAMLRLAALAGAAADVVDTSSGLRAGWRSARLLMVGADLAPAAAAAGLPRRHGVVVVSVDEPATGLWRTAVELGAENVLVLPADDERLVELIVEALEQRPPNATLIAVVGGCGGSGASTLAAALAITTARRQPTMLVDADRLGGGIDVLLAAEARAGTRWPGLAGTRGRLPANALTAALPAVAGLAVLSWGRGGSAELPVEAATAVMAAAAREFRCLVVDLPRRLDPAATVFAAAAELVALVVPATVRAVAAATSVIGQLPSPGSRVELVVTDPGGGRLSVAEVAGALGLPVAASLRRETAVASASLRGTTPLPGTRGSLHDACRAVLARLADAEVAA